jgi:hypothetical protein
MPTRRAEFLPVVIAEAALPAPAIVQVEASGVRAAPLPQEGVSPRDPVLPVRPHRHGPRTRSRGRQDPVRTELHRASHRNQVRGPIPRYILEKTYRNLGIPMSRSTMRSSATTTSVPSRERVGRTSEHISR